MDRGLIEEGGGGDNWLVLSNGIVVFVCFFILVLWQGETNGTDVPH